MLSEEDKLRIYRWRAKNPEKYKEYVKNYYANYRENNYEKELKRVRKYRLFNAEAKRLRNILM